MSTATVAKKTATPRKTAAKAVAASQTTPETVPAVVVDPDVYVAPTGLSDGFEGNGSVPLDRLSKRALENLTELATDNVTSVEDGNTPQARKYWTAVLARYGVKVTPVAVVVPSETVDVPAVPVSA